MPNKREESISLEESPIVSGMKEERKASLLSGGAGWSECCSANVPRVKPRKRVIAGID